MKKKPFVTLEKIQEITEKYPTPFHLYDEKGIRENAKALKKEFVKKRVTFTKPLLGIKDLKNFLQ